MVCSPPLVLGLVLGNHCTHIDAPYARDNDHTRYETPCIYKEISISCEPTRRGDPRMTALWHWADGCTQEPLNRVVDKAKLPMTPPCGGRCWSTLFAAALVLTIRTSVCITPSGNASRHLRLHCTAITATQLPTRTAGQSVQNFRTSLSFVHTSNPSAAYAISSTCQQPETTHGCMVHQICKGWSAPKTREASAVLRPILRLLLRPALWPYARWRRLNTSSSLSCGLTNKP
jgi:hypothetical protein